MRSAHTFSDAPPASTFVHSVFVFWGGDFPWCLFLQPRRVFPAGEAGVVLIGPLDEVFLREPRACAIPQKGGLLIALWPGGSSMFYSPELLSCLSRVYVCWACVCVCVRLWVSALLPVLPHQSSSSSSSSFGGSADRLLWRSVLLTRDGFPSAPMAAVRCHLSCTVAGEEAGGGECRVV